MNKVQQEELVSKSIIFTAIILVIMFYTKLVQNGAFRIPPTTLSLMINKIVVGFSIVFLVIAVVFVILALEKIKSILRYLHGVQDLQHFLCY